MTAKLDRPRPETKHGLASDVRSGEYETRTGKRKLAKPAKARSPKSRAIGRERGLRR